MQPYKFMKNQKGVGLIIPVLIVLFVVVIASGIYYFTYRPVAVPSNTNKIKQTIASSSASVTESASPSGMPAYGSVLNSTQVTSPDGSKVASFILYYEKGGDYREGSPSYSDVTVLDKSTGKTVTDHLSGAITYANNLYWSPVDNRIYFTHFGNGIGIYALWSSKIDGTDAKLISGYEDHNQPSHANPDTINSANMAIYGAGNIAFSPDGKTVLTDRAPGISGTSYWLWLMSYDGTNSHPIKVTGDYQGIYKIQWESDGKHINFTDWSDNYDITYQTDINGATPKELSRVIHTLAP